MLDYNLSEEDNFHSSDVAAGSAGIGHNYWFLVKISDCNFVEYGPLFHEYKKWVDLLLFAALAVQPGLANFVELTP